MDLKIKSTLLTVAVAGLFVVQPALAETTNATASSTQNVSVPAQSPETNTYGMILSGLGLMGFVARRRKQVQELA